MFVASTTRKTSENKSWQIIKIHSIENLYFCTIKEEYKTYSL